MKITSIIYSHLYAHMCVCMYACLCLAVVDESVQKLMRKTQTKRNKTAILFAFQSDWHLICTFELRRA